MNKVVAQQQQFPMSTAKINSLALRQRKQKHQSGPPIVMITAYDAMFARLFDEAGVDILLVGDSLGMVIQGHPHTLTVTVDEVCYHGRAVARGTSQAHLVGDMPFLSFQVSPEDAVRNAGKMIKEGSFEAVKLEGGQTIADHIHRIVAAGIPVMGHVGLTPQHVHAMGGFRVQGKTPVDAERVLNDAKAVQDAGAYSLVLEGIPAELAAQITASLEIPTLGIGAGNACDGQVLVGYDMLGLQPHPSARFVKRYAELGHEIITAVRTYAHEVRTREFPTEEHSYQGNPSNP